MARLSEEVKTLIVNELAMFRPPSAVSDVVKETFGLVVDRRQVEGYNPLRPGQKPAERWCRLFDATRAKFLDDQATIGIAQRSFRLRELEALYWRAHRRGNDKLAAEHLRQAAEEVGGMLTNRRELSGKDGAPLIPEPNFDDLSLEQLAALATQVAANIRAESPAA